MEKIKYVDLFSGIGATCESFTQLENEGICQGDIINFVEWEEWIAKAYAITHNVDINKNLGDISLVNANSIQGEIDLMTYGFPCQDLSILGTQKGLFDEDGKLTRSGLFFEAIRIAKGKKPKVLIAENVKSLTFKNKSNEFNFMLETLEKIGYNNYWKVMDAKKHGLPHSRQRVFIVSIRKDIDDGLFQFPRDEKLKLIASDLYINESVTDDLYLNEHQIKMYAKNEMRLKKQYSSINKNIQICQTTKQGQKSNPQNFIEDDKGVRIMNADEYLVFQGFRKGLGTKLLRNGFNVSQVGFMAGNSLSVNIMKKIIINTLSYY